jgi:hypothetical protein
MVGLVPPPTEPPEVVVPFELEPPVLPPDPPGAPPDVVLPAVPLPVPGDALLDVPLPGEDPLLPLYDSVGPPPEAVPVVPELAPESSPELPSEPAPPGMMPVPFPRGLGLSPEAQAKARRHEPKARRARHEIRAGWRTMPSLPDGVECLPADFGVRAAPATGQCSSKLGQLFKMPKKWRRRRTKHPRRGQKMCLLARGVPRGQTASTWGR